ncbi:MAG: hypothetical protein DIJKHBIC_04147 [Thermoanaerobaculia bacterium]|nr:hypothetical protein [Thermoanaerobaculia bacterium]
MHDVSRVRLYILRAACLLIVIGLGADIWPSLLFHQGPWKAASSAVSMPGGSALACALGIRYPWGERRNDLLMNPAGADVSSMEDLRDSERLFPPVNFDATQLPLIERGVFIT